jgi:hypothetical protein
MRSKLLVFVFVFLVLLARSVPAQQSAPTSTTPSQAATLLAQSAAALSGSVTVSDVTLNGNAQQILGSDNESGTVVLKAMAPGESLMDLTLPSGDRSQVRSFDSNGNLIGAWSGPDAVQHPIAFHNMLTDSSWFFPALTLNRVASSSSIAATYIGQESLNGQSVLHVTVSQIPAVATAPDAAIMQHLTQMDFYLNPTTYLPVALAFNTHPDSTELTDISVQVLFSNYQAFGGVQVPTHVQQFLNGCLSLDLQIQSVTLNSGLTASGFTVQVSQ